MSRAKTITLDYRDFLQGPYQIQVPEGYKRIQLNAFSMEKNEDVETVNWLAKLKDLIYNERVEDLRVAFRTNVKVDNVRDHYQLYYKTNPNENGGTYPLPRFGKRIADISKLPYFSYADLALKNIGPILLRIFQDSYQAFDIFEKFLNDVDNFGLFRTNQYQITGFIPHGANFLGSKELDEINAIANNVYQWTVNNLNDLNMVNDSSPFLLFDSIKFQNFFACCIKMREELIPKINLFKLPIKIVRLSQTSPLYDKYVRTCPEAVYLNIQGINSWRNTAAVFNGEAFILGMQGNTFELCSSTLIISMNDIEGNYFNASTAFIQFTFI